MLTIDFELEQSLQTLAKQEHSSPNDFIKKLLAQYLLQRQPAITRPTHELNVAVTSPITQSLAGLLAKSNLSEQDYKQHLADKYL